MSFHASAGEQHPAGLPFPRPTAIPRELARPLKRQKAAGATVNPEIEIALLDLRAGTVDKAHERLMNLVKEYDSARARQALAEIEMRSGPADGPARHYLKALQLEPNNAAVMNNLAGYLAFYQKKYDDALFRGQKGFGPGSQ